MDACGLQKRSLLVRLGPQNKYTERLSGVTQERKRGDRKVKESDLTIADTKRNLVAMEEAEVVKGASATLVVANLTGYNSTKNSGRPSSPVVEADLAPASSGKRPAEGPPESGSSEGE